MNNKSAVLFIITTIVIISCTKSEQPNTPNSIEGIWYMVNKTGGFAGVDCTYDTGIISWTFDNTIMTIDNNDTTSMGTTCEELSSSSFSYSILNVGADNFLILENEEQGGITLSNNELIIDQNKISNGAGADGFIWKFVR